MPWPCASARLGHAPARRRPPLMLGGISIRTARPARPFGCDALLHAITDALFGAAALGDIGRHFPDSDDTFKGADSGLLLAEAARRVRAAGWQIVNVDSTIVAQAPRLGPHIRRCRAHRRAARAAAGCVNVKARRRDDGSGGEGGRSRRARVPAGARGVNRFRCALEPDVQHQPPSARGQLDLPPMPASPSRRWPGRGRHRSAACARRRRGRTASSAATAFRRHGPALVAHGADHPGPSAHS